MWWRQEPLVRCVACAALFWLEDIEPVGIMPQMPRPIGRVAQTWVRWRGDPEGRLQDHEDWAKALKSWGRAQYIGRADFDDVVHVLSRSKGVSSERLLWLRSRIWWDLNDRYRTRSDGSAIPDVPTWPLSVERTNMEVILDMLRDVEAEPWNMIQQGELLRLLGRFDDAVAILKAVPADSHSEIRAIKIQKLAEQCDTQVREMIR